MEAACSRRQIVLGGLLAGSNLSLHAASPPLAEVPCPDVQVLVQNGENTRFLQLVAGRCCAVQFMFTTCSTICGVEGARFASLAQALLLQDVRLMSLSVDVLGDDAARLRQWRARFPTDPRWLAAVPKPEAIEPLLLYLRGNPSSSQSHSAQVYLLDRRGRLCHRSEDAPAVADLAARLLQLHRRG